MHLLLTGISGVGKSSVVEALAARGLRAVDLDTDAYSEWVEADDSDPLGPPVAPGRDWQWRADRVRALLDSAEGDLFVSGCAPNMGPLVRQFDYVVLLSAPASLIAERLLTRTNNPYGQLPGEVERVIAQKQTVEPLLRRAAGHEIDTSAPLAEVVAAVLRIAGRAG